jgi:hypothetical protein
MLIFVKTLKRVLIVSGMILVAVELAACRVATTVPTATTTTMPTSTPTLAQDSSTPIYTPTSQQLSTPELIDQSLARSEITEEERLLYLAYALYEHESLPIQFRSNYEWFGEEYVLEIREALTPPEVICSMSPHVRSEFIRLFDLGTLCN